jgi:hypothetical protein
MLFYTYVDKDGDIVDAEWHVGEPVPEITGSATIDFLQADGQELEHIILKWVSNLPIPNQQQVVRWCAPWAELILLNL